MSRVFIGLGANQQNPQQQLHKAIASLKLLPETRLLAVSSFYQSRPWGGIDHQADFINAVAELGTTLTPEDLLQKLQQIEQQQGRVRTAMRWGPRTLDLDILLYEDLELTTEKLTIPHPYLTQRAFVLCPLVEIAPDCILPNGVNVKQLVSSVDVSGLIRIGE